MRLTSRAAMAAAIILVSATVGRAAEVDNLLPKETEFVVQINVKQLLESDIVKRVVAAATKKALSGKDAKKFTDGQKLLEDLGFDPMKDVEKVTLGIWGTNKDDGNAIMIARGAFDAKKIKDAADAAAKETADKVAIVQEGDLELIKLTGEDGRPNYIVVVEGKFLISGSDKKFVAAAAALAVSAEKPKPVLSKELTALVLKQDAKASLFACGITTGKFDDIKGDFSPLKALGVDGDKIKAGIGKMGTFALTVSVGKEVGFGLKMGMKDDDSADDFAAEISKLVTAAKTFLPIASSNQPTLKNLLDDVAKTLDTTSKDKFVAVTVKVAAESIGDAIGGGGDEEKDKDR